MKQQQMALAAEAQNQIDLMQEQSERIQEDETQTNPMSTFDKNQQAMLLQTTDKVPKIDSDNENSPNETPQ